jgi:hypothetical protein
MTEEVQTIFQAVIKVGNCVKNSPLRGRFFAKLCDDMDPEHKAPLCYCEIRWLSRAKVLHTAFELKEEMVIIITKMKQINFILKILFRNWPIWQTFLKSYVILINQCETLKIIL